MEIQENFSSFDQPQTPPANNMALSIVGTVLGICSPCCIGLIVGIVAIVMSSQVNNKFNMGDHVGAASSAKNARILAYVAIGLGIIGLIYNAVMFYMVGTEGYLEMIEEYKRSLGG